MGSYTSLHMSTQTITLGCKLHTLYVCMYVHILHLYIHTYIHTLYVCMYVCMYMYMRGVYTTPVQDGRAHNSLSPREILYFTLAYDWFTFGYVTIICSYMYNV